MTVERYDEDADQPGVEATAGAGRITAAPIMPGRAFVNMFDKYAEDGLPDVFDISFFNGISGSTIAQHRSTMRFFTLIDEQYHPTDLFRSLVAATEEQRRALLKVLVERLYPDVLALSPNATSGQLARVFNERGISGATVDKAISFLLFLLDYLDIPYSPHFKKRRPSSGSAASSVRRRRERENPAAQTPPPPPPPRVSTEDEQKAKYIDMLMKLAEKDDATPELQKNLMDRIEKALGIGAPGASEGDPTDLL